MSATDAAGEDHVLGLSVGAARRALGDTCVTRVVLPAVNFLAGPLFLSAWIAARGAGTPRAAEKVLACVAVSYVAFVTGIPCSLALFPQTGQLPLADLEPPLQTLAATVLAAAPGHDAARQGSGAATYNKGL